MVEEPSVAPDVPAAVAVPPRRPWPMWAAFLAAMLLAVPGLWLFNALEPGPDGGGVPRRVLVPLFWTGYAAAVLALAWVANRRAHNGMRWVVATGVVGLGYAAGLVAIGIVALSTFDCDGPTTAEWAEPGLRQQFTAEWKDDYTEVRLHDDGSAEVRWSDGPLDLRMTVLQGDRVVLEGNIDGASERVLRAAVEDRFDMLHLPAPRFDGFLVGRELC